MKKKLMLWTMPKYWNHQALYEYGFCFEDQWGEDEPEIHVRTFNPARVPKEWFIQMGYEK